MYCKKLGWVKHVWGRQKMRPFAEEKSLGKCNFPKESLKILFFILLKFLTSYCFRSKSTLNSEYLKPSSGKMAFSQVVFCCKTSHFVTSLHTYFNIINYSCLQKKKKNQPFSRLYPSANQKFFIRVLYRRVYI